MSDLPEIAFDDLEGLRSVITEEWSDWGPEYEMTQEKVNQFADLTGDHQWIHVDVERANAGPFGGPIAHGFFTLSLLPTLNRAGHVKITGQQNVVNYGADGMRLLAPFPWDRCFMPGTGSGMFGSTRRARWLPPRWLSTWWATTTCRPCSMRPWLSTRVDYWPWVGPRSVVLDGHPAVDHQQVAGDVAGGWQG